MPEHPEPPPSSTPEQLIAGLSRALLEQLRIAVQRALDQPQWPTKNYPPVPLTIDEQQQRVWQAQQSLAHAQDLRRNKGDINANWYDPKVEQAQRDLQHQRETLRWMQQQLQTDDDPPAPPTPRP